MFAFFTDVTGMRHMSALSEWDSFYLIVGGAAGALIGLQFVVMTLIAERPQAGMADAARAFATPTVVHFGACLLVAAFARVPWPDAAHATWAAGAVGLCGLGYMALPIQRMRRQQIYKMDLEDRTFHIILPFVAYGLLMLCGLLGLAPTRFRLCSASPQRRCCCSLSASTMPGMRLPIRSMWCAGKTAKRRLRNNPAISLPPTRWPRGWDLRSSPRVCRRS